MVTIRYLVFIKGIDSYDKLSTKLGGGRKYFSSDVKISNCRSGNDLFLWDLYWWNSQESILNVSVVASAIPK